MTRHRTASGQIVKCAVRCQSSAVSYFNPWNAQGFMSVALPKTQCAITQRPKTAAGGTIAPRRLDTARRSARLIHNLHILDVENEHRILRYPRKFLAAITQMRAGSESA